jgi:hypothetical protein
VVLRTALRAVMIALATIFIGGLGVMMGIWSLSVTLTVVFRSLLVIALLPALTRSLRIRDRKAADEVGRPSQQVLIAAGIAFVLNVAAWGGHALFGQLLTPVGVLAILLDLVVWMAVATVGVRLGDRASAHASTAPIPYA